MSYTKADDEQHPTEHAGLLPRASRRRGRPRRAAATAAAFAAVSLLAAACGRGAASTTATSAAQGGNTATDNADEMPYTQCMRAHGVPNFPDPNAQGKPFTSENLLPAGINPDSPQVAAASTTCAHLLVPPSPEQLAQQARELVRYAECMRAHGLPDFPDPSTTANGGSSLALTPAIVDSPDFQPAEQACHSIDPGLPTLTPRSKSLPAGAQAAGT
jgi:hypothetical protein